MSDVREIIKQRLKAQGKSMAWLSRELGRNHAYVQQFVDRHSPQQFEYRDAVKVSKLLGIALTDLGVDPDVMASPHAGGAHPSGLREDAESYVPPPGSYLATAPGVEYLRARSNVLDKHALAIRSGDILVVDISAGVLDRIVSGDAVIVQLYHKPECMAATTVMRQFVAPGLLITNSSGANEIMRMDDDALPFEPVIKGKIVSVLRGA